MSFEGYFNYYLFQKMETNKNNAKAEEEAKELKKQLENYHTLGITQSARGQVVLVFGALLLLSLILSFFAITDTTSVLLSFIIYIPILIFIYKGYKWAMITLMVLWTGEKIYTAYLAVENGGSIISSIIWLIIGLSVVYKALKVENLKEETPSESVHIEGGIYCSQCGTKQEIGTKFCSQCGAAML